jgi:geranylgeranyl pyrophosphate synthase
MSAAVTLSEESAIARDTFSDSFLADMSPELSAAYLETLDFCKRTVLATVGQVGSLSFLRDVRGGHVPDDWQALLHDAWVRPFRSYLGRSGKMLRPFLVCLCMKAYGRDPARSPVVVALSEMIHSSSLLLDDIVDDSELRRGGPSGHTQVGIRVSGTLASAWLNAGFEMLQRMPGALSEDEVARLMREIAWEHWVTGIGTTIDVVWPTLGRFDHAPHEYLQSVVHRSTSYTYRLPLKIGAIAAGASEQECARFAALGEELGIAFQLIDDILNLKPADGHWGKTVAEDITEGKITLLVLLGMQRARPEAAQRLAHILQARTRDRELLSEAISIMEDCGAFETARRIAREHVERTHRIVEEMHFLPERYRRLLADFVNYVVDRSR